MEAIFEVLDGRQSVALSDYGINMNMVPIDDYDCSTQTLEYAVGLAVNRSTEISLGFIAEPLFGSVKDEVAQKAPCPVMAVKKQSGENEMEEQ